MTKAVDVRDLFNIEMTEDVGSYIKTTKQEMCNYKVFLDEEIGEPSKYRDLINLLYMGTEVDQFNLFINSMGGNLASALAIVEAIKGCDGIVRAIINGECHSAASIIALNCHEIVVTEAAHSLIHTASYGTGGNAHMVKKHVDFSSAHIRKILKNTYEGFLTEDEFRDMEHGIEFWFDSTQIKSRLNARFKFLETRKEEKAAAKKLPAKKK